MMAHRRVIVLGGSIAGLFGLLPRLAHPAKAAPMLGERFLGRLDAPVTVVEYFSLTCGNCARFHIENLPRIKSEFIDTGLVRLLLRDFPLDRVAVDAAIMVRCVGAERLEPLLALLYAQKEVWAHSREPRTYLRRAAILAGVAGERVDACWADPTLADVVLQSRLDGQRDFGVDATPSFIINHRLYRGVLTFEQFATLVRPLISASRRN